MSEDLWADVDRYLVDRLLPVDAALEAAGESSRAAGLPDIQVSPPQGKLLWLLARACGARAILEIGTLGGYSTIWLARALPPGGRLITLEADEKHARVARENLARAGLTEVAEVRVGRALDTLPVIAAEGIGPFDVIFIDADKPSNTEYFEWALRLSRKGSLILVDNVVRDGAVADATSDDPNVRGVRRFFDRLAAEPRVSATALQTVGTKGYDGFAIAIVTADSCVTEIPTHPVGSSVRTGYDRWAAVYDHDLNPLPALEEPFVREAVGDVRGLSVLDLGCGTGRHALWLAAAGARVTALDFSEGMLAAARTKPGSESVRFVAHDLHEPLPFPGNSFDLVVSGLVLEHVRNLPPFFAEARRVLKSGGRALVSAMHPAMFLRGSQARFTDPQSGEIVQPGSYRHGLGEFVMAAIRAGFRLEEVQEHAPDGPFAARYPRAGRYVGWPMLVVLRLLAV